jgi:hypothetical protein
MDDGHAPGGCVPWLPRTACCLFMAWKGSGTGTVSRRPGRTALQPWTVEVRGTASLGRHPTVWSVAVDGLGQLPRSWVAQGPNQELPPQQLEQAIGPEVLTTLTQRTGPAESAGASRPSRCSGSRRAPRRAGRPTGRREALQGDKIAEMLGGAGQAAPAPAGPGQTTGGTGSGLGGRAAPSSKGSRHSWVVSGLRRIGGGHPPMGSGRKSPRCWAVPGKPRPRPPAPARRPAVRAVALEGFSASSKGSRHSWVVSGLRRIGGGHPPMGSGRKTRLGADR